METSVLEEDGFNSKIKIHNLALCPYIVTEVKKRIEKNIIQKQHLNQDKL